MPEKEPEMSSLLDDRETVVDRLDFEPYTKTIAEIISDPNTDTPLTIGIYGGWGSVKTSLMNLIGERLDQAVELKKHKKKVDTHGHARRYLREQRVEMRVCLQRWR